MKLPNVARVLKLNRQTVRNWIDGRMLPPLRVGSRVRVRRTPPVAALDEAVVTPASCLSRGDGGAHERHRQAAM